MKSKFKWGAYFLAVLTVLFLFFFFGLLVAAIFLDPEDAGIFLIFDLVLLFPVYWVVFGELRTKAIAVDFGFDNFTLKNYLGLGKIKTIYYTDLQGFRTSILYSRGATYEYLYIMQGDKKIAKLSEFYHGNYAELKREIIDRKIHDLGFVEYKGTQEIKDMFIY